MLSVSVYPPCQLLNAWTNLYETWYVTMAPETISAAYFINPSHQSMCLYVYPLSLLGNGSVKLYRGKEYTCRNRSIVGLIFCAVRVVSDLRRLVLPTTSCLFLVLFSYHVCKIRMQCTYIGIVQVLPLKQKVNKLVSAPWGLEMTAYCINSIDASFVLFQFQLISRVPFPPVSRRNVLRTHMLDAVVSRPCIRLLPPRSMRVSKSHSAALFIATVIVLWGTWCSTSRNICIRAVARWGS
jgi:hypothetical protein